MCKCYFVGEPFAAKAELDGSGRVLYYAKDIWPHFISCVLVVHEKLIKERKPPLSQPPPCWCG
jgi:NitT/TauT family transport system substrate-binding protein